LHYAERELFRYTKGSVARHRELPSNAQEKAWYMFERSESCHAQALRPVVSWYRIVPLSKAGEFED